MSINDKHDSFDRWASQQAASYSREAPVPMTLGHCDPIEEIKAGELSPAQSWNLLLSSASGLTCSPYPWYPAPTHRIIIHTSCQ